MANPFDQFDAQPKAQANPFDAFDDAPPMKLGGPKAGNVFDTIDAAPEKPNFGIDFSAPHEAVRKQIQDLPEWHRKQAYADWAQDNLRRNPVGGFEGGAKAAVRGVALGGSWVNDAWAYGGDRLYAATGGKVGAPYDETKENLKARDAAYDKEHPYISTGLKIGGAIASIPVTPMVRTAQGASMLAKMGTGAVNGAGYGFLHGTGTGEGTSDRLAKGAGGAAMGFGIGAAAPPIAAGVGNMVKYVADKFRGRPGELAGMHKQTAEIASKAAYEDRVFRQPGSPAPPPPGNVFGDRPYQMQQKALGDEGMLGDMGPTLQQMVGGVAARPGAGRTTVIDRLVHRLEDKATGSKARLEKAADEVAGPAQNLVQREAQVLDAANAAARPFYKAFENAGLKADDVAIASILDRAQKMGLDKKANEYFTARGIPENTAVRLDQIKKAADSQAQKFGREGDNFSAGNYSTISDGVRKVVDNTLSPGAPQLSSYAVARRIAGDGQQYKAGLEYGEKLLPRQGVPTTHPHQVEADLARMTDVGKTAVQDAWRGRLRDVLGSSATKWGDNGASTLRRQLNTPQNQQIAEQVLGDPGKVQSLMRRVNAENVFDRTNEIAYRNSLTAMRSAAEKSLPPTTANGTIPSEFMHATVPGLAITGTKKIADALLGGSLSRRNDRIVSELGDVLTAQGPRRDALANALMSYGQGNAVSAGRRDAIERIARALMVNQTAPAVDAAFGPRISGSR